jgi:hypothetical protein
MQPFLDFVKARGPMIAAVLIGIGLILQGNKEEGFRMILEGLGIIASAFAFGVPSQKKAELAIGARKMSREAAATRGKNYSWLLAVFTLLAFSGSGLAQSCYVNSAGQSVCSPAQAQPAAPNVYYQAPTQRHYAVASEVATYAPRPPVLHHRPVRQALGFRRLLGFKGACKGASCRVPCR